MYRVWFENDMSCWVAGVSRQYSVRGIHGPSGGMRWLWHGNWFWRVV